MFRSKRTQLFSSHSKINNISCWTDRLVCTYHLSPSTSPCKNLQHKAKSLPSTFWSNKQTKSSLRCITTSVAYHMYCFIIVINCCYLPLTLSKRRSPKGLPNTRNAISLWHSTCVTLHLLGCVKSILQKVLRSTLVPTHSNLDLAGSGVMRCKGV